MRFLFTIVLLRLYCSINAQVVVKPQAIISTGKSFQKPNAGVTFTVGEIVVKPMVKNDVSLSNGVIASAIPFIVTAITTSTNDLKFQLFPNPSSEFATFKMEATNDVAVLLKVTDVQGKQVIEQNLPHSFNTFSFAVNEWTAGLYILNVYNQKGENLGFIKFQKL